MLDDEYCRTNPYEIKPGEYVQLCITDDGVGMDEETKKNLKKARDLPVMDRMARSFMKVHAEREMLAGYVKDFEKQHNELDHKARIHNHFNDI